jgi:restriction system protein
MSLPAVDSLPRFEMLWPVLEVIKEHGGSATVQEIDDGVVERMELPDEAQSVLHGGGPRTEIGYRLAWCRTYLRMSGALENSARGVWAVTDAGRRLTEADAAKIPAKVHALRYRKPKETDGEVSSTDGTSTNEAAESGDTSPWREQLLGVLMDLAPDAFERLCQRLLREAGFISVEVTGKSGDGGIDGIGMLQMSLLSFPVFFQSKRYKGAVRAAAVRDFRGAMSGRGDKGLLITTGTFTPEAKREARRAGAPPIDLIDGDRLCELLREFRLGVEPIESAAVTPSWFDDL